MSKAKMTLIGMQMYMRQMNTNLFGLLSLPDGIDKGLFEDSLLLRGGEFETLYADPFFMQEAIKVWGKKWYRTFEKWITALNIEYAPLENYDRHESWTEDEKTDDDYSGEKTEENSVKTEQSGTSNTEQSGTINSTGTSTAETSGETENTVSAYNSNVYEPDNKSNTSGNAENVTADQSETTDTAETVTTDEIDTAEKKKLAETNNRDINRNNVRTGRAHGNIGVTTSQQMLEAELDIAKWNLYDKMGDLFVRELLIPVYI